MVANKISGLVHPDGLLTPNLRLSMSVIYFFSFNLKALHGALKFNVFLKTVYSDTGRIGLLGIKQWKLRIFPELAYLQTMQIINRS